MTAAQADLIPLLTTSESFGIRGRVVSIVEFVTGAPKPATVKVGDSIVLVKPDGHRIHTRIVGLEFADNPSAKPPVGKLAVVYEAQDVTELVPPGSKILVDSNSAIET